MLRRGFYKNGYSTMEIKREARWKKPCALFDGENSSHTGQWHEKKKKEVERDLAAAWLVTVEIDFQLPVFEGR